MHTASTIGYGHVVPVTLAANIIVAVEALVAMISFALVAGIVFARFARPLADIAFSSTALVAPYRGIQGLEFRIANRRRNQILELRARVFLSRVVREGEHTRRNFEELTLERNHLAFFPLGWTIVHPITESSPLFGKSATDLRECEAEILITLTGIDETFSHTVHARSSYKADEIVWDARFVSIYERPTHGTPGTIDVSRIGEFETV